MGRIDIGATVSGVALDRTTGEADGEAESGAFSVPLEVRVSLMVC